MLPTSKTAAILMPQSAARFRDLVLFCGICYLICSIDAFSSQQFSSGIDRIQFLSIVVGGGLMPQQLADKKKDLSSVIIPLRFLPVGGCWAIKVFASSDEKDEKYYAVVDTGSPFLTAPSSISLLARTTSYPMTNEQYGQTISETNWKKVPFITILTDSSVIDAENVVVGIEKTLQPGQGLVESFFAGLVNIDDNRPTFLEQLSRKKINGFRMSFSQNYLQLSPTSLIDKEDPEALPLVDLQPYGPDLYHYAVDCKSLKIRWNDGRNEIILASNLKRPVWLVLDTGLTGCIFSDSLLEELQQHGKGRAVPDGISVSTVSQNQQPLLLKSSDQYWAFSSFRLPWFTGEKNHPHIVALGCTFWTQCDSLTIDVTTQRAKITPRQLKS